MQHVENRKDDKDGRIKRGRPKVTGAVDDLSKQFSAVDIAIDKGRSEIYSSCITLSI